MKIINVDGKQYQFDQLPKEAKAQLVSIQFVDSELQLLKAKTAALQTARIAYVKALQAALLGVPSLPSSS